MNKTMSSIILCASIVGFAMTANAAHHETDSSATEKHKAKKHYRGKSAAKMLKKVDTNQDGNVDLTEYLAHAEQRFQKMDLNSDGLLTLEEGRESHKAMRKKHKAERKAVRQERKKARELESGEVTESDD